MLLLLVLRILEVLVVMDELVVHVGGIFGSFKSPNIFGVKLENKTNLLPQKKSKNPLDKVKNSLRP